MDEQLSPRKRRNVEVFDSHENVVAGFWQYGTLKWDDFYRYLDELIVTSTPSWMIFGYDTSTSRHGEPHPACRDTVIPGHYVLLSSIGDSIRVGLVSSRPRPRISRGSSSDDTHCSRVFARDGKCLITGLESYTYTRLKVANMIPPADESQAGHASWLSRGNSDKTTRKSEEVRTVRPSRIDPLQNGITLRKDLCDAWDGYEFGVDTKQNYCIVAFIKGLEDINGRHLQLDHIEDPNQRPLDELLDYHFTQGLLSHVKGTGESEWSFEEVEDVFEDRFDMSNRKLWDTREGKEILESALADRLFDLLVSEQDPTDT
ncbi:hypothetical protein CVT26_014125 [Gymnopilus dilepis]|uniref:HNH nuclease domain-containing protein n=1 Tax=Gymnopilus dilepis TaxID=231916 RepID=A0A409Y7Y8_9AGAR|nr:hypothetical protein CVT26_014125 [Gymnopilus dilepis]